MESVLIGEILAGLMFFGIIGFLLLGFPVAFTLAGVSLMFGAVGMGFGVFDPSNFGALPNRYIGFMTSEVLVAVPLFIFMGVMLERSNIAEQLLLTMAKLFGNLRGGLGMSVIIVGAMLAASTGVVGATVVTMGLISLPAMLRAGYDPKLATGVICASGTLGQIIPPSTVLIFMGDMLSGINSQVQMEKGNFAPTAVSVGDLFAGALLPGFLPADPRFGVVGRGFATGASFGVDREYNGEFTKGGINKATGMDIVMNHFGMEVSDAVAFGDSQNDIPMLRYAGVSVAMGDGAKPALEAADHITTPLLEDGIWNGFKLVGLI